jgi:hypothetical protein
MEARHRMVRQIALAHRSTPGSAIPTRSTRRMSTGCSPFLTNHRQCRTARDAPTVIVRKSRPAQCGGQIEANLQSPQLRTTPFEFRNRVKEFAHQGSVQLLHE